MIAIFSQQNYETSTELVMDWLKCYHANYIRINGIDFFLQFEYSFEEKISFFEEVTICWYRRWDDLESIKVSFKDLSSTNFHALSEHLGKDVQILKDFLFKKLKDKKWLSPTKELSYSRLDYLEAACAVGLQIPVTLITTSKEKLLAFQSKNQSIITKVLAHRPPNYKVGSDIYNFKTILVTPQLIDTLSNTFLPSLFQKTIEKQYELRVFFLEKALYAMAIFSQKNAKTKVDFRNYDNQKPNRTIPYQLPTIIQEKIFQLIDYLNLTTGSIDLIKSIDGAYIFLEINPVGQFGMVSYPCNYFLEKRIAQYLIHHDRTIQ